MLEDMLKSDSFQEAKHVSGRGSNGELPTLATGQLGGGGEALGNSAPLLGVD